MHICSLRCAFYFFRCFLKNTGSVFRTGTQIFLFSTFPDKIVENKVLVRYRKKPRLQNESSRGFFRF